MNQTAEPESVEPDLMSPRWRRSEDQHTLSLSDVDRITGRTEGDDREMIKLSRSQRWLQAITGSLNFYRIHLLTFTFLPLISAAIFHACNTQFEIDYIDALFVCVSSMTVTGLSTLNLSTLSGFQQAIVFMNMFIGSPIFVSLIMITVRKYFFRKEFDHMIEARRKALRESEAGGLRSPLRKLRTMSQNFTAQNRPNLGQSSWIDRFKRKAGRDSKRRSDSPTKEGEIAPSEDSSHFETARETWKKDISQEGVFTANPTYATSERVPETGTPSEKPQRPRPTMERQPTNWAWHWGKHEGKPLPKPRINADMIKRVEGGGLGLINPMGWYQSSSAPGSTTAFGSFAPTPNESGPGILDNPLTTAPVDETDVAPLTESPRSMNARLPDVERTRTRSPDPDLLRRGSEPPLPAHSAPAIEDKFPRTKTIAFDGVDDPPRTAYASGRDTAGMYAHTPGHGYLPRTGTIRSAANPGIIGAGGAFGSGLDRTMTGRRSVAGSRNMPLAPTMNTGYMPRTKTINQVAKHQNFGGFPTPLALGKALFVKVFPDTGERLKRNLTMHRTVTQAGTMTQTNDGISEVRPVDYISFDAIVGRNSHFHDLTKEEHDELGGVEYRSLRILFWIVLAYYILLPLIGFIIVGPYIRAGWDDSLQSDTQYRYVPPFWFSAFQMWSAFSNTGMSLNDLSMVPYQKAYPMVFVMVFLIFAGNTAFPIFLRFSIWVFSKVVPKTSRTHETLKFLLDHPRRCFVYLFPSTQTWFLFLVMITLTYVSSISLVQFLLTQPDGLCSSTDFVSFMVLDIGTPDIEDLPVGIRVVAGIFQSTAVRAAGFGIVPLNSLAPAVKVLYVVMQYISVYPVAMSIRATNVYEERSLGLWNEDEDGEEPSYQGQQAVAKYLGWHARRQLAFDIWWLAFALWLICIIERGNLNNPDNATWFNIFNVIFEIVSAYGTVGLSLGVGFDNFSLVGSFSVLSKLVIIAVMIRGRHRGLPVAIDRAIMLPKDFTKTENIYEDETDRLERRPTRRGSMASNPATGVSVTSGIRRESNLSGEPSFSHHRSASAGENTALSEPHSPKVARRTSVRSNGSQPETRPDRSPERARAFSVGRLTFETGGLPRSLSTVQESGLSRAPTRRDTAELEKHANLQT